MEHTANRIELCGTLAELPQFSHENHDRRFFRFPLEVERLSGAVDILPVLVPEQVLDAMDVSGGSMLEVTGPIRSFNNRAAEGRRLIISVFAETLCYWVSFVLRGTQLSLPEPNLQNTASGKAYLAAEESSGCF